MVLELVPLGSMLDFLTDHPDSVRTDMEIPLWVSLWLTHSLIVIRLMAHT